MLLSALLALFATPLLAQGNRAAGRMRKGGEAQLACRDVFLTDLQAWAASSGASVTLMGEDQPVRVGVATWNTQVTYKDAQLEVEGQRVYLPSIALWHPVVQTPAQRPGGPRRVQAKREWSVDSVAGTLTKVGNAEGLSWLCPTPFSGQRYRFTVQARKESGSEGFLLVFGHRSSEDYCWFNIGGWDNTRKAIEQDLGQGRFHLTEGKPFAVEEGRWYSLCVAVEGQSVSAYIDGQLQFVARTKRLQAPPPSAADSLSLSN